VVTLTSGLKIRGFRDFRRKRKLFSTSSYI